MNPKEIESASDAKLIQAFASAVELYIKLRSDPTVKPAISSKQYKAIARLFDEAERRGEDVVRSFQVLFDDPRPEVKLYTAAYLEHRFPDRAENVYRELSELPGLLGFSAQGGLERMQSIKSVE